MKRCVIGWGSLAVAILFLAIFGLINWGPACFILFLILILAGWLFWAGSTRGIEFPKIDQSFWFGKKK